MTIPPDRHRVHANWPRVPKGLDMPMDLEYEVTVAPEDRVQSASIRFGLLHLTLADGREVEFPLDFVDADSVMLAAQIEIEDDGTVLHFPLVPEWIYVPALLGYPLP